MTNNSQPYFIEIEIGTYCNRVCSWCPNGWDNRGKKKDFMSQELWEKIISDLSRENYSGWLAFHNYNEPLTDPTIFEKIKFVNKQLPNSKTAIYTNGDYLNKETSTKLINLEIKEIRVTLYPMQKEIFIQQTDDKILNLISDLNFSIDKRNIIDGKRGRETKFKINQTTLHIIIPNIKGYTDRAGKVEIEELKVSSIRQQPCYLPSHSAAIDYKCNLKLCCQVYDVATSEYSYYNIGNISSVNFWDLWNSDKMKNYRAYATQGKFETMKVCQLCSHSIAEEQIKNVNSLL